MAIQIEATEQHLSVVFVVLKFFTIRNFAFVCLFFLVNFEPSHYQERIFSIACRLDKLREHVISISADNFHVFHGAEVEEVRGTVNLVIELFRIGQLQLVTHVRRMTNTCEQKTNALNRQGHIIQSAFQSRVMKTKTKVLTLPNHN